MSRTEVLSLFGPGYFERRLDRAGWVSQAIAGRADVCQEQGFELKVYVTEDDPAKEYSVFWQWMPGWSEEPGDDQWVQVVVNYAARQPHPEAKKHRAYAQKPWESIAVSVRLPDSLQVTDLAGFCDEATLGWRQWVDRQLIPQGHEADWRISRKLEEDAEDPYEGLNLYPGNPYNDEDDKTTYLFYEDLWDQPFNSTDCAGLSQKDYLNAILDAFGRSWKTVTRYLEWFNREQLPKLVAERENRVNNKAPGWLYAFFRQRKDVTDLDYTWLVPDEGIEPDTHAVSLSLGIKDSGVYSLLVTYKDLGDGSGFLEFIAAFPADLQAKIVRVEQQSLSGFPVAFRRSLTTEAWNSLQIVFTPSVIKRLLFDLIEVEAKGVRYNFFGLRLQLFGSDTQNIYQRGVSQEEVINKLLSGLEQYHRLVSAFLADNSPD